MSGVHIVTDSACDLSDEEVTSNGITVVPLSIRFGDQEFVDREQLSVSEFYRRMAESPALPETAAPAPGRFERAFRDAKDAGADGVVCVNLSSALSATMQSAQAAAKAVAGEIDVRVVDSRSLTAGLGTQVLLAARAAAEGRSTDDVVALLDDLVARTEVYATLDTLENLKKGGRVGGAKAMLGSLLSFKPIIRVAGEVEEAGKQRTRRRSLEWLSAKLDELGDVEHLAVMHGEAPDVDQFLQLIAPRHTPERQGLIGPVIGTHGGPRVIGFCCVRP